MEDVKRNSKKSKTVNYSPKKDNSLLFIILAILSLFIGLILIIEFYSITIISFYTITRFLVGFALFGFLIPLKYYQKWFQFIKYEMIIFNVIGVAPLFTAIFLLINFTIPLSTTTEDFKIEKFYFDNGQFKGVILDNHLFSKEPRIVEFQNINPNSIKHKGILRLTLSKGLFGFEVVKYRKIID